MCQEAPIFKAKTPLLAAVNAQTKEKLQQFKQIFGLDILCENIFKDAEASRSVVALASKLVAVYSQDDLLNLDHESALFLDDLLSCGRSIMSMSSYDMAPDAVNEFLSVCAFEGNKVDRLQASLLNANPEPP